MDHTYNYRLVIAWMENEKDVERNGCRKTFGGRRKKMDLEEYCLGSDLHGCFRSYRYVYRSMALANEHRCSLVQHDVQLVYVASTFVAGVALITIFVIYLKNK